MLRFEHTEYLKLIFLIPLVWVVVWYAFKSRKKKLSALGTPEVVERQIVSFAPKRIWLKSGLLSLALFIGLIALANLQAGVRQTTIQRKGIDIVIALDVSKSMLAGDMSPSRLQKAKQLLYKMFDKLPDHRIALVVFAGKAYRSVPLTIDFSALKMNLETTTPDIIPTQGTVLDEAIKMSVECFDLKDVRNRAIVLVSDGEDHDEDAKEAAKEASKAGIVLHTVGVGSPQGITLLEPNTNQPKTDENGNPVVSKLNEEILKEIATIGKGSYHLLNNIDRTSTDLANQLNNSNKQLNGTSVFTEYNSYFQYFLSISLLLVIIEHIVPTRKINK